LRRLAQDAVAVGRAETPRFVEAGADERYETVAQIGGLGAALIVERHDGDGDRFRATGRWLRAVPRPPAALPHHRRGDEEDHQQGSQGEALTTQVPEPRPRRARLRWLGLALGRGGGGILRLS